MQGFGSNAPPPSSHSQSPAPIVLTPTGQGGASPAGSGLTGGAKAPWKDLDEFYRQGSEEDEEDEEDEDEEEDDEEDGEEESEDGEDGGDHQEEGDPHEHDDEEGDEDDEEDDEEEGQGQEVPETNDLLARHRA